MSLPESASGVVSSERGWDQAAKVGRQTFSDKSPALNGHCICFYFRYWWCFSIVAHAVDGLSPPHQPTPSQNRRCSPDWFIAGTRSQVLSGWSHSVVYSSCFQCSVEFCEHLYPLKTPSEDLWNLVLCYPLSLRVFVNGYLLCVRYDAVNFRPIFLDWENILF